MNHSMTVLALLILVLFTAASGADLADSKLVTIDFTNPREVFKQATWTDPKIVQASEQGLSLNWNKRPLRTKGIPESERGTFTKDVIVHVEPVPVGWSWRPVTYVWVGAEVTPPEEFVFLPDRTGCPPCEVFARYSPDLKNWSSWQALERIPPDNQTDPRQTYQISLQVPVADRSAYESMFWEYMEKNVPWKSDEEAAVEWILEQQPDFFEDQIPFIGYVQLRFEIALKGDQRIERLEFRLSYQTGGSHNIPKDESVYKDRNGPWRFRAK
ncbi:MAG: hypothetical protein AMXMBFR82_27890 [Candidatus Hydrogenedentota bacterium]